MHDAKADGPAARWFARFTARVHAGLPPVLARALPTTFIGYALINGSAFVLDMAMLTLIGTFWHLPYGVTFSIGYALASVYAFFLNRTLNFREHGDLGRQSTKYTFVIVSNYVIWILGFGTLLGVLGVQLQVARVIAACIEGVYIYVLLRFWVFTHRRTTGSATAVALPALPGDPPDDRPVTAA